jgi:hypothetical protein
MTDNDVFGIVELMGHLTLSGRITKPGEYGGLWQIDIPEGDTFRTEFFGSQSVYRIRIVSEEIARAYVQPHEVIEYNAPILTRAEHEAQMDRLREQIHELNRRLATPAISDGMDDEDETGDDTDDGSPDF